MENSLSATSFYGEPPLSPAPAFAGEAHTPHHVPEFGGVTQLSPVVEIPRAEPAPPAQPQAAAEPEAGAPSLERMLLKFGLLTPAQLGDAMREESASGRPLWEIVQERGWVSREDLIRLAERTTEPESAEPAALEPQVVPLPQPTAPAEARLPLPDLTPVATAAPVSPLPDLTPSFEQPAPEPAPAVEPTPLAPAPEYVVPLAEAAPTVQPIVPFVQTPLVEPAPEQLAPVAPAPVPVAEVAPVVEVVPAAVAEVAPVAPAPIVEVAPIAQPEPEPIAAVVALAPAPEPVAPLAEVPPVAPAPAPQPAAAPIAPVGEIEADSGTAFKVVLRLMNGERIDAHTCKGAVAARRHAEELVRGLASGPERWPYFSGRFVRPESIVSVDVEASL